MLAQVARTVVRAARNRAVKLTGARTVECRCCFDHPCRKEGANGHIVGCITDPGNHGRLWRTIMMVPWHRCYYAYSHTPCACNLIKAVRNRVLQDVPKVSRRGFNALKRTHKTLFKSSARLRPYSYAQILRGYTGGKLRAYERAYEHIVKFGLTVKEAVCACFVKMERWNPLDGWKDPRVIQFRPKTFTLSLMRFVKPIEEWLYHKLWKGLPCFSKGKTNREIAADILALWTKYGKCLKLDCSRFDAHVRAELLKLSHEFYRRLIPDDELRWLNAQQIHNKVKGMGIYYRIHGSRMSGDADTALGNCYLMVLMTVAAMDAMGYKRSSYGFYDNGDDLLLFHKNPEEFRHELVKWFYEFGQDLEVEGLFTEFSDIEFCHTKPVLVGDEWTMVRDPARVMSHAVCGSKYFGDQKSIANMCHTVGSCELSLNAGVPVLQEFAKMLMRLGEGGKFVSDSHIKQYYRATQDSPGKLRGEKDITVNARLSMAAAWDISVPEQLRIENWCRKVRTLPTTFPFEMYSEQHRGG